MKRKGDVSEVLMTIFALVIAIVIISLLVPKIGVPSMNSYGNTQGRIAARILSSSINLLSAMESGEIYRVLERGWDIEISCASIDGKKQCYVEIKHDSYSSGKVELLADVDETIIRDAVKVKMSKEFNENVKVEKMEGVVQ